MAEQLAEGVVRLGTKLVNWYLVEEGGKVTVVDAGLPRYRPQLAEGLALLERRPEDVAAVLLTHGHGDHTGVAEILRTELGVPVLIHSADEELARTFKQPKREASMLPYLRHAHAWKLLAAFAAGGRPRKVKQLQTYEEGVELDVPGRPVAIHTPGHTLGHCALRFESRGVLVAGDLICTLHPLTGATGPQLLPRAFNASSATAFDSLAKIEDDRSPLLVVGHGEPWREGAAAAVERTRAVGPT
jgi:glyoxylase-like metal-dependent hydrolase (beta-lactamase superfamily II)